MFIVRKGPSILSGRFVSALGLLLLLSVTLALPSATRQLRPSRHFLYVLDPRHTAGQGAVLVIDPDTLKIVHSIQVGGAPEMEVSPSGRHLYLTYWRNTTMLLSVIDTGTWQVRHQLPSPGRIQLKLHTGRNAMVCSPDGTTLYIHKWRSFESYWTNPWGTTMPRSDHWWARFDTSGSRFLRDTTSVPNCGAAQALPTPDGRFLVVLCFGSNDLVFVDLHNRNRGGHVSIPGSSAGTWPVAAVPSSDWRQVFVILRDGTLAAISTDTRMVERKFDFQLESNQQVLAGLVALDQASGRLYVGTSRRMTSGFPDASRLRVLDTANWKDAGTLELPRPIYDMDLSPDGRKIYGVNPNTRTLVVLNSADGRELQVRTELGGTSAIIRLAPSTNRP